MSYRAARSIVAAGLVLWVSTGVEAQPVVTPLFPGITHIKRTEQLPPFQCPGCPAPTPNPRLARMNILLIDLTSPAVRFKRTRANGWHQAAVSVSLEATDLANGLNDTPPGWVDQLRYSLAGAQTGAETTVPGHSASFGVTASGVTKISYAATDAAGNEEDARTLDIKIDGAPPVLSGVRADGCTLWPTSHKLQRVAVLRASDAVSGIARGAFQVNATSNEPMDPGDVAVTEDENGALVVELRAERSGTSKTGRVYQLTSAARDLAGNEVTGSATCIVPHDQGKEK